MCAAGLVVTLLPVLRDFLCVGTLGTFLLQRQFVLLERIEQPLGVGLRHSLNRLWLTLLALLSILVLILLLLLLLILVAFLILLLLLLVLG